MKKIVVQLIIMLSMILQGCGFISESEQERLFTEITFPEVEKPVNVRSFEKRKLSECFTDYKTYLKPDEFPFYPGILKGEIIYGKTWDMNDEEKGTNLGFIDFTNNTSGIIETSSFEKYSNMVIETISNNKIIYLDRSLYHHRMYSLDIETGEKTQIEDVDGVGMALYAYPDDAGVMFSRSNPSISSESSIFQWNEKTNKVKLILEDGQGPFKVGKTWYCRTIASSKASKTTEELLDEGGYVNLARFTEDSHEEIQVNGLYGTLVQALSYDDTHMILVGYDSKKGKGTSRVYMFDTDTEEVSYLFDINDYMEGVQIRGNYITWLGSEEMHHGTRVYSLFDLKNNIYYPCENQHVRASEDGVIFDSYEGELVGDDERVSTDIVYYYARWSDLK